MRIRSAAPTLIIGLTLVWWGALASAAPTGSDALLVGIVRQALAAAPTDFRSLRTSKPIANGSEIDFKPLPAVAKLCPDCVIADEFATAKNDERWSDQFDWRVDKTWTQERLLAYALSTLGPLVPGATFTQGTYSDTPTSWLQWKRSKSEFLYAQTLAPDKQGRRGFIVRVVHYLPTSIHVVRLSRGLTAADRTELVNMVRNYVTVAMANVDTNFESLRGKESTDHLTKNDPDQYFDANMSFGELMDNCDINSFIFAASDTSDTSHWIFSCTTVTIGGPKADALAVIHDAVAAALPYGFTVTTDPQYMTLLDYRWDRSSDKAMVSVSANDEENGTSFFLNVHHYIANP